MEIRRIPAATRDIGKPQGWDDDVHGPCASLPVRDEEHNGVHYMVSAWAPTPEQLAILNEGGSIRLGIAGYVHPVVFMSVAEQGAIS
jgi:hypothetical protein